MKKPNTNAVISTTYNAFLDHHIFARKVPENHMYIANDADANANSVPTITYKNARTFLLFLFVVIITPF